MKLSRAGMPSESLSLSDLGEEFSSLGSGNGWVSTEFFPMIKDALREGTA